METPTTPPTWETVRELYWQDEVLKAWELALQAGLGAEAEHAEEFRLIEGEALTRKNSKIIPLGDEISLEFLPSEVDAPKIGALALQACGAIRRRFGVQKTFPTLISILARAVSAPWATYPHGYCEDKYPYEKICLPHYLTERETEFSQAVAHEYTHVLSLNIAQGKLPTWLEEALSVLAEGTCDPEVTHAFQKGIIPWLSPSELECAFSKDEDSAQRRYAYEQAGWVGQYLAETYGEDRFRFLMDRMAKPRWWWALANAFLGTTDVDWAIRETYGITLKELFERTRQWLSRKTFC
jgi:hypothetical protein